MQLSFSDSFRAVPLDVACDTAAGRGWDPSTCSCTGRVVVVVIQVHIKLSSDVQDMLRQQICVSGRFVYLLMAFYCLCHES